MTKRRKDKDPVQVMPQQLTWKTEVKFDSFEGADDYRNLRLLQEPNTPRKIKRRKNSFDVRVGTPIKKD